MVALMAAVAIMMIMLAAPMPWPDRGPRGKRGVSSAGVCVFNRTAANSAGRGSEVLLDTVKERAPRLNTRRTAAGPLGSPCWAILSRGCSKILENRYRFKVGTTRARRARSGAFSISPRLAATA